MARQQARRGSSSMRGFREKSVRYVALAVLIAVVAATLAALVSSSADAATRPAVTVNGPSTVVAGRTLTLTGTAQAAGDRLRFFVSRWDARARSWKQVATGRLSASGRYSVSFRAGPVGRQRYQVMMDTLDASFSGERTVRVLPA
ncbi:hypothetical protein [Motilibacter aurantiacus]|uniref:hypothetical protein n=1 Tax=Motilibacter aurantiacus TaxID=2714955 RepID=UPI00140D04B6|nr:hypothetical protein [Motilibacter aurantiacus]NHC45222.1 hypothetical protein [Motilibacter aurantiacus]